MDATARQGIGGRIVEELLRPVDLASRVVFRMGFAAIMIWEFWRFYSYGWIERYWIEPDFHFKYFGFGWVEPWSGNGMYVHIALIALLALAILTGFLYRFAMPLFFAGFTYVFLLEQARYLNHFYLVCLMAFVLIFVPANRLFAVDVLLRPAIRSDTAPAWSLWLLRFQLGVVYFYGGLAKLNHDWVRGEPIAHWIDHLGDTPGIGWLFVQSWSGLLFAWSGLLMDFGVVPLLLWRRTRPLGFAIVVVFNLMNAFMFSIGIFPWMMIVASTIFFSPDWPRRALALVGIGRKRDDSETPHAGEAVDGPAPVALTRGCRRVLAAIAVYAAIQLLFPLRHWLYPGVVHWTEEGHRFAWHMKLRDKNAQCWLVVYDPHADESWEIYPEDVIEDWQESKMCTRPDMILQLAHSIATSAEAEGIHGLQVRAHVFASLHGRPYQSLIDPDVDLAAVPRTLRHARWIRPMNQDAPMGDF